MKIDQPSVLPGQQRGVALIVALILLMVLTMIAVVAMRMTTIDLKITTNRTMQLRTFQISESARAQIDEVLEDHSFYRGWPVGIGGEVPASSGFTIPDGIVINDTPALQSLYLENNYDHWDTTTADAYDMQLLIDPQNDDDYTSPDDMAADLFISRIAAVAAPGSDTKQVSGYEGLGAGVAGAGSHLYFRIISVARGAGASRSTTEAHYRYVITN